MLFSSLVVKLLLLSQPTITSAFVSVEHKQIHASPSTSLKLIRSPNSVTNFHRGGALFSSAQPPPSRVESLYQNAKSIKPLSKDDSSTATPTLTPRQIQVQSVIAGLAVSLAMIPEAIAFSFVAGVSPLTSLWTTVILGFFAASFGGRAGLCSSASGAVSVVIAGLCASHGPGYVSACALLGGLLQILGGVLGLGKFIRLVPHPVMLGFVNGLALVMTEAQLVHFMDAGKFLSLGTPLGRSTYGVCAATMALVKAFPRLPGTLKKIPPSLGAVTLISILAKLLKLPAKTLADVAGAATFRGGAAVLPKIGFPAIPFSLETLKIILPYACTMAAVGAIESLLTLQLLDGMADDGKRGSTKKECFGQGIGNVACGLSGGIGGCALLGQSIINVESGGGLSKLSGMSMAMFLGLGIVSAAPLLGSVPVAALVGVMLLVCQSTFSWSSLRLLGKIPKLDAAIIVLVSAVTVKDDLAKGVLLGTICSALGFAWKQSTSITATISDVIMAPTSTIDESQPWKSYALNGPLFFGSTQQFATLFAPKTDPQHIVIDFTNARVMDSSALDSIQTLAESYGVLGKTVHLRHLSWDCARLLKRNYGEKDFPPYEIIESDPESDPAYGLAVQEQ